MLTLTPINLKTANAFVQQYHRHHKPTRGHKFSIGVSDNGALVGVAICGRPVARRLDDGYTLEVNRLCTDGTPNACSILYAAAYRAARAMGYSKVITYILDTENGASLKAAGYTCEGRAGGLEWNGACMAADRKQQMKEITERLEQGVKDIFTSEMYTTYLRTMAKFHNYSFNNTLLIAMQRPDATMVAGYLSDYSDKYPSAVFLVILH